jgi:hypothetical protein
VLNAESVYATLMASAPRLCRPRHHLATSSKADYSRSMHVIVPRTNQSRAPAHDCFSKTPSRVSAATRTAAPVSMS